MRMLRYILVLVALPALGNGVLEWESTLVKQVATPGQSFANIEFVGKNTGDEPVEISAVEPSCSCMTATPMKRVVAPGEQVSINIRFEFGGREGEQRKQVEVTTSGGKRDVLELQVDIPHTYAITPKLLSWKLSEGRAPKSVRMINESKQAIVIASAQSSSPFFEVSLSEIRPGFEYEVRVVPAATGDSAHGVIAMSIDSAGGQETRTYKVYAIAK